MRSIVATLSVLMGMSLALVACATPATPAVAPAAPTTAPATATVPPATPTRASATPTAAPTVVPTAAPAALRVTFTTNPPETMMGNVEFIVEVRDAGGQPVNDAAVTVSATHTGMGMSISGKATAQGSGRYAVQGNLSMGGSWVVNVEIKKAGMQTFTQEFALNAMDH